MFMMEKAMVIIVFMWAIGFSLLGVQYVFGDVLGITLTSPVNNAPVKSCILSGCPTFGVNAPIYNVTTMNQIQSNVTATSRTSVVGNINSFLGMVWELILLLTGTYVFYMLYLLGVPSVFCVGMVGLYFFFLIRAFFGYIRGI